MWLNSGTETNYFPIKNLEKPLWSVNSYVEIYAKHSQKENWGINLDSDMPYMYPSMRLKLHIPY